MPVLMHLLLFQSDALEKTLLPLVLASAVIALVLRHSWDDSVRQVDRRSELRHQA